jgi:hypothetical protein
MHVVHRLGSLIIGLRCLFGTIADLRSSDLIGGLLHWLVLRLVGPRVGLVVF